MAITFIKSAVLPFWRVAEMPDIKIYSPRNANGPGYEIWRDIGKPGHEAKCLLWTRTEKSVAAFLEKLAA